MSVPLSGVTVQWRGATLYGRSGPGRRYVLSTLTGWESRETRREVHVRPRGHGYMGSAPLAEGRTIRLGGLCRNPAERDALLAELDALFALTDVDSPPEDVTITLAGRTLSAPVWLTRFEPLIEPRQWGVGLFRWRAELQSDDWLRYGPAVSATASFPRRVGGLVWPLFPSGVMDWGPVSASDRATVHNPGTAPAPVQVEVTGPVDAAGFEVLDVATGRGLTFVSGVAAGSRVLLDGATGNALVDGLYDRGDVLTTRFWPTVPPGGSLTLALRRRGSDIGGAPSMTVTVRPAYW